ncbi:facilitated trehalose transporter Tret1-like [Sitophilus oryzae]|uniref:Facilitated trehalose transporter Tret1-like n=1 Tax=Sitophilus oryzae TaxID=7048 RepID=A0A6J2YP36_SITOR|nr:facilitated trehalose transporter Tret1-like [Sitophilus oryzae]
MTAELKNESHTNISANGLSKVDNGKRWPQILAILTVSLGSFTNGVLFVWSSPFTLVITKDKENYSITESEASYFNVMQPVGMLTASLFFFKIAEFLGRKKAVMSLALPHLISWIITIFARSKWEFYAARIMAGIADACMFCSVPPYVGEICTPEVRGFWGNVPTFILYVGQVCITILGSYLSVQTTAYICMTVPIIFVVLVSILPESPYQLIKDGKYDEAKSSIMWLQRKENVEHEFVAMKFDVERQTSESARWRDLIFIESNRKALRAGTFLRFSQQLSGVAVFASYTQPIFEKAGGSISPQISSMIFLGLIAVLNLFCSFGVDRFGRRLSYFYSILICGFILLGMSLYFIFDQYQFIDVSSLSWFPLAGMLSWTVCYSFGLGVVPTLMLGELFSVSIKSKGLCILIVFFGLSVFLTTNLFHLFTSNIGMFSPYMIYGLCCLVSAFITLRWVPETKGKTLEEIQQSLKKGY